MCVARTFREQPCSVARTAYRRQSLVGGVQLVQQDLIVAGICAAACCTNDSLPRLRKLPHVLQVASGGPLMPIEERDAQIPTRTSQSMALLPQPCLACRAAMMLMPDACQ